MRIEIVQHDTNRLRLGIQDLTEVLHLLGKVYLGPALSHRRVSLSCQGFHEQKHVGRPGAAVLIIHAGGVLWAHRQRGRHVSMQLLTGFIKTHHGALRIVGFSVQLQHILHLPDKLAIYALGQAPRSLLPGLERVFFSTRNTVSSDICSTTCKATNRLANKHAVHRTWPWGAGLQASATTRASAFPSSLAGLPERGRSWRAAGSPCWAKRLRIRATVAMLMPTWSAISSSVSSWAANSKACRRARSRADKRPRHCCPSSSSWPLVNLTTYCFSIPDLPPS